MRYKKQREIQIIMSTKAKRQTVKKVVDTKKVKEAAIKTKPTYAEYIALQKQRQDYNDRGMAILKEMKAEVSKRPGVIRSILEIIETSEKPVNETQILAELQTRFPDRAAEGMTKTIKAQIGGRKRPLRMELEKKVAIDVKVNKAGVRTYSMIELAAEEE